MKLKHDLPFEISALPTTYDMPSDIGKLLNIVGSVLLLGGAALWWFVDRSPVVGVIGFGLPLMLFVPGLISHLKFQHALIANKKVFDEIRTFVHAQTGIRMSRRDVAQFWIERSVKAGGYNIYAAAKQARKMKIQIH